MSHDDETVRDDGEKAVGGEIGLAGGAAVGTAVGGPVGTDVGEGVGGVSGVAAAHRMKRPSASAVSRTVVTMTVLLVFLMVGSIALAGQAPVGLGTAKSFAVLAHTGITNTGETTISGNVGSFPTASESGFAPCPAADCVNLTGTDHAGDLVTQGAKNDLDTAYTNAANRTPVTTLPTELGPVGGQTLVPGVYDSEAGTFGITGTLTLDAESDPNGVFIFLMQSSLITGPASSVSLLGDAQACNVYWVVGSSATLDTGSTFVGNILALDSIQVARSVTINGRLLARTGTVTLIADTITRGNCTTGAGPTPSPSPRPTSTLPVPGDSGSDPIDALLTLVGLLGVAGLMVLGVKSRNIV